MNNLTPEFGTLEDLRHLFGITRTLAYELEAEGSIQFVRIRKRGNLRGKTLVKFDSVRAFLSQCEQESPKHAEAAK